MAQKVQVILVDDLDDGHADETVSFGIDGSAYEIDLSTANAKGLRDALARYVGAAHKIGRSGARSGAGTTARKAPATTDREQTQAIRAWAKRNGHTVSDRGRIPAHIVEAYHAAV